MKRPDITPGPWRWQGTNKNPSKKCYLSGPPGEPYVGACLDGFTDSEENARAIAALPDILDALARVCIDFGMGDMGEGFIEIPRETGEVVKQALLKAGYTF